MAKILIADASTLVRPMLSAALSNRDWTICGEASNGREAILLAFQLRPDLILFDFLTPILSGLEAAAEILKIMPLVPIVLYTTYDNPQLDGNKIGIRKIVTKANSLNLVAALEEILGKPHLIGPLGVSDELDVAPRVAQLRLNQRNHRRNPTALNDVDRG